MTILTVMHTLWQAPLQCASSTSLTSTLSTVLLTTRVRLAPVQLDAQARVFCTITTATTNNTTNFISRSLDSHCHRALFIESQKGRVPREIRRFMKSHVPVIGNPLQFLIITFHTSHVTEYYDA